MSKRIKCSEFIFRWFCNGCWQAWEDERREQRLNTGKLLPEDRELWYSNATKPINEFDLDDSLSIRLSLSEQFRLEADWLSVDMPSLTIETYLEESPSTSSFLTNLDEKPRQVTVGELARYSTLNWRVAMEDEFVFDFSNARFVIGSEGFPVTSLATDPNFYFPKHVVSDTFKEFRALAREARKYKQMMREIEEKKQQEIAEQKRKQQMELQAKQKELLQLAIKRAQNKKPTPTSTPPSVPSPPPKPSNVWSSFGAAAVKPSPPQPIPTWSSRPMVPPPMAPAWSANMMPIPMVAPVTLLPPPPMHDPWSSAAAWSVEPNAKRAKTPSPTETPPHDTQSKSR